MTIIVTGVSNAVTQARRMKKDDTICKKHQADWANSCPRSPAMTVGSTTKHTKKHLQAKQKKRSHRDTYIARHAQQLLDKPRPESPGRALDNRP